MIPDGHDCAFPALYEALRETFGEDADYLLLAAPAEADVEDDL